MISFFLPKTNGLAPGGFAKILLVYSGESALLCFELSEQALHPRFLFLHEYIKNKMFFLIIPYRFAAQNPKKKLSFPILIFHNMPIFSARLASPSILPSAKQQYPLHVDKIPFKRNFFTCVFDRISPL